MRKVAKHQVMTRHANRSAVIRLDGRWLGWWPLLGLGMSLTSLDVVVLSGSVMRRW